MFPSSSSSTMAGGQGGGPPPPPVYLLNCSVCKGEFNRREKWMEHLTQEDHQKMARECLHKDLNTLRDSSLMVFTTYDLTVEGALNIVQYFGRNLTAWVTDLLWWKERPRFAIVQFESRKKVEEVVRKSESFAGAIIQIGNQSIQVKGAFDLLDLEWQAILPASNPAPVITPKPIQESESSVVAEIDNHQLTTNSNPVAALIALSRNLYGISPAFKLSKDPKRRKHFCRIILNGKACNPQNSKCSADTAQQAKLNAAQFCLEKFQKEIHAQPSHLIQQFTQISQFVEIPDEKCEQVYGIARSFRDLLQIVEPSAQVIIFRNWYLKLRNSPADIDEPLFIYIYAQNGIPEDSQSGGAPPSEDTFIWLPGRLVEQAINQFDELFQRLEKTFPHADDPQETRLGCEFLHKPSGIPFTVANFRSTLVEAQCCRLVKYFCEFDPRIRPLLILARYWMITNGIHLGEPQVSARTAHQCLPEPHPLDWLILTFLIGGKYVPSLRTILARPHKVILERATGIDVGFTADMPFAREWKREKDVKNESGDHVILQTLQIFQNFLEFCCTQVFDQGGVIINAKDGEVLKTSKFFGGDFTSELSTEEISVLKQLQENNDSGNKAKYCVDFKRWNWYMMHPLVPNWRFSVPRRNQELITINTTKKTNERLKKLLKLVEKEGAEKTLEICGATLCEILKVDKEIPSFDPVSSGALRKRPIDSIENEGPSTSKKVKVQKSQPAPALVTFDLGKSLPPPPKGDRKSLAYQLYSLLEKSVMSPDNQFNKVDSLLEYLCKFDGQAYLLIKMTYCWMGINKLTLGAVGHTGHLTLKWLVVFWMCHMKMVPSPSEIQGSRGAGEDLGWEEDQQFLENWRKEKKVEEFEWKEEAVVNLLYKFKEFLEFCGWLRRGNWILNTRLGMLIDAQTFLNANSVDNYSWAKRMTKEEVRVLRAEIGKFGGQKIYMTHPLNMQWRLGTRGDIELVLRSMGTGGLELKKYLHERKLHGKNFHSLRNVFTV